MPPQVPIDLHIEGKLVNLREPHQTDDIAMSHILGDTETMKHLPFLVGEEKMDEEGAKKLREIFIEQVKSAEEGAG